MRKDIELMDATNHQIMTGFKVLCRQERMLHAEFLAYLNAVDERKLFAAEGYSSLCGFVVKHLNYSESTALKRIQVARAARKFPTIYYLLQDGEVSLSNLERVAPHLTHANAERLLKVICHQSVRSVDELLATEFPKPDAKDRATPLSEDKVQLQFTVSKEFIEKLERAKAMLCRKFPKGRAAEILGKALEVLLNEEPKRTLRPEDPFPTNAPANAPEVETTPRYIPRRIRNEVWIRDKGCCQFKGPSGNLCGETRFLEYDHVLPWALGGSSHSINNIRLQCRTHNQWNARQYFQNWEQYQSMTRPSQV